MIKVELIHGEIDMEREMQVAGGHNALHDDLHTSSEWIALLTRHVGLAVDDGTGDASVRLRKQAIRVAALAVACVESLDRKTVDDKPAGVKEGSGF